MKWWRSVVVTKSSVTPNCPSSFVLHAELVISIGEEEKGKVSFWLTLHLKGQCHEILNFLIFLLLKHSNFPLWRGQKGLAKCFISRIRSFAKFAIFVDKTEHSFSLIYNPQFSNVIMIGYMKRYPNTLFSLIFPLKPVWGRQNEPLMST